MGKLAKVAAENKISESMSGLSIRGNEWMEENEEKEERKCCFLVAILREWRKLDVMNTERG